MYGLKDKQMRFYFYKGELKLKTTFDVKANVVKKIRKNKKIKKGDLLFFQDAQQKRYRCSVLKTKSSYLEFEVIEEVIFEKPDFFFSLFIPYLKNKEIESLLFKATEMGVEKFCFFESDYSLRFPEGQTRENKFKKWESICQLACENSGRGNAPKLIFAGKISDAVQNLQKNNITFFILHPESKTQEIDFFKDLKQVAAFVGPQKGFSDAEMKTLDCIKLSLGKNFMKPETAALMVSAISIFKKL